MNILAYLGMIVWAAETIISPVPDALPFQDVSRVPDVTFGNLSDQTVLGTDSEAAPTPVVTPAPKKSSYTITLLGDSMIDTLGPDGDGLGAILTARYPETTFHVRNAGVGATNIEYGLFRLTHGYTYLGKDYPAVLSNKPDILVVESFAYNPQPLGDGLLDSHWLALAKITDTVRAVSPETKIVIAATISPNSDAFGDGAEGLSFSPEERIRKTDLIKSLLINAGRFAESQNLLFADAFHPSLDGKNDGNPQLINADDHIHYSPQGADFFRNILADTIISHHLLE